MQWKETGCKEVNEYRHRNQDHQRKVLIPRIPMTPKDLTFAFKRLQFPVRLAFAMSLNKSQGQSFQVCGIIFIYLRTAKKAKI